MDYIRANEWLHHAIYRAQKLKSGHENSKLLEEDLNYADLFQMLSKTSFMVLLHLSK